MVRFIIFNINSFSFASNSFTFQYGQIYYELILNRQFNNELILHSNMVRFIIKYEYVRNGVKYGFTFQYGQIYYKNRGC